MRKTITINFHFEYVYKHYGVEQFSKKVLPILQTKMFLEVFFTLNVILLIVFSSINSLFWFMACRSTNKIRTYKKPSQDRTPPSRLRKVRNGEITKEEKSRRKEMKKNKLELEISYYKTRGLGNEEGLVVVEISVLIWLRDITLNIDNLPFSLHRTNRNSATKSLKLVFTSVSRRHNLFRILLPSSGFVFTSFNGGRTRLRMCFLRTLCVLEPSVSTINTGDKFS